MHVSCHHSSRFWALPGLFIPLLLIGLGVFHQWIPEPKNLRDQEQLILLFQLITVWWWPLTFATVSLSLLALIAVFAPAWRLVND